MSADSEEITVRISFFIFFVDISNSSGIELRFKDTELFLKPRSLLKSIVEYRFFIKKFSSFKTREASEIPVFTLSKLELPRRLSSFVRGA